MNWLSWSRKAYQATRCSLKRNLLRPGVESLENRCLLSSNFLQTNLVSDIAGVAATTDPQLINPWGLTASSSSPFWVSDNQTGFSTLYNSQGTKPGLVVSIPSASNSPFNHATPTGTVFNTDTNPSDFNVTDSGTTRAAIFLFDTLDGTIDGWNGASTNAVIAVQNPGAIYTGLAIDTSATAGNTLLYAADWGKGTVDVFNGSFQQIDQTAFQDKDIPSSFRPFNVQDIGGNIYVTYAQFDPTTGADSGTGGFVAQFSRDGQLEMTIKNHGHLNSPWGVAMAPAGFGDLGGDLLVGNFGDGRINAFDSHGHFVTQLRDGSGKPIAIENLWALRFGNGGLAGNANTLFFTAGPRRPSLVRPMGFSAHCKPFRILASTPLSCPIWRTLRHKPFPRFHPTVTLTRMALLSSPRGSRRAAFFRLATSWSPISMPAAAFKGREQRLSASLPRADNRSFSRDLQGWDSRPRSGCSRAGS
jgi:uncharacterized protein (TIGR03118 family)